MSYSIIEGSIEDALIVDALIPEFEKNKTRADFDAKLSNRKHLILVARYKGKTVAYNVGYEITGQDFYCWLFGVLPEHRRKGIAAKLRAQQERWARDRGYQQISVKSKNRFPVMLQLLIASGYQISGYENTGSLFDNKIHFTKKLPEK